jgi:hypothetical protein
MMRTEDFGARRDATAAGTTGCSAGTAAWRDTRRGRGVLTIFTCQSYAAPLQCASGGAPRALC